MGILLLNILAFGLPQAAYSNPRAYGGWHGADLAVWAVNFVLFDGKMRGLFSFLFGASLLLVTDRAEASGMDPASVHYRRMIWLLAFGCAHLWLVWDGDILVQYALVGMLVFSARELPVARLVVLGTMLAIWGAVLFFSIALPALHPGPAAASLTATLGVPAPQDIAREIAVHRADYWTILTRRWTETRWSPFSQFVLYGPETAGYMLFGMASFRSGMLTRAWSMRRYVRWLAISWAIAVPGYILLAVWMIYAQFSLASVALAGFGVATLLRPLMILGWICLILLLARPGGPLTNRIAAAGRMAFSNYLGTSLICTMLFYGYGLGWFGALERWRLYLVVLAIWAAMLLWSRAWLIRFRYGPFEWIWRSLARGGFQPMRIN
jgi:uncharacterized protein